MKKWNVMLRIPAALKEPLVRVKEETQKSINELILHFIILGLQQEETIEFKEVPYEDLHIRTAHKALNKNITDVQQAHHQIFKTLKEQNLSIYACSLYPALAAHRIMLEIAQQNDPSSRLAVQKFANALYEAADYALQENFVRLAKEMRQLAYSFMPSKTALALSMLEGVKAPTREQYIEAIGAALAE